MNDTIYEMVEQRTGRKEDRRDEQLGSQIDQFINFKKLRVPRESSLVFVLWNWACVLNGEILKAS